MSEAVRWDARLSDGADEVAAARALLRRPVEELLAVGGDDRQTPREGRNSYGFPLSDLDPVVRGSSCTATPPDRIALSDARAWTGRVERALSGAGSVPLTALRDETVSGIAESLGLPGDVDERVVLTPSGTDTELLVVALALHGRKQPVLNVLVGALEAGAGVPRAAAGRHVTTRAPFTECEAGAPVDGLDPDRVRTVDVELRDAWGRPRRPFDVEAEVEAHLEDGVEHGEQVVIHAMAGSKSGLAQLGPDWVRAWSARQPDVRFVVDAAQSRMARNRLRAYLDAGASVSITGSKAMSGPPFSGALVLSDAALADARAAAVHGAALPSGLRGYLSRADLPAALRPLLVDAETVNLGLLARWAVVHAESARRRLIPLEDRMLFAGALVDQFAAGLARLPGIRVLPIVPGSGIVPFTLAAADGAPSGRGALADVYREVVASPGVHIGQPVEFSPGGAAALRFAVGSTTITRALEGGRAPADAARDVAATAVEALDQLLPHSVVIR